jgi:anti-sigma factor RsiW
VSAHVDLRPLIDGVDLPAAERREVLAHLQGCAACRAELAGRDASLLFSVLALEPVPAEVLERVSERAAGAIAHEQRRSSTRRAWAWGSLAASILVAALGGAYFWSGKSPHAPPPIRARATEAIRAPAPEAAMPAGMIELLESPGDADVVEMSIGDVEVVMIFDEAMEI